MLFVAAESLCRMFHENRSPVDVKVRNGRNALNVKVSDVGNAILAVFIGECNLLVLALVDHLSSTNTFLHRTRRQT